MKTVDSLLDPLGKLCMQISNQNQAPTFLLYCSKVMIHPRMQCFYEPSPRDKSKTKNDSIKPSWSLYKNCLSAYLITYLRTHREHIIFAWIFYMLDVICWCLLVFYQYIWLQIEMHYCGLNDHNTTYSCWSLWFITLMFIFKFQITFLLKYSFCNEILK